MLGTILNAMGILIGGIVGMTISKQPSPATQVALKGILGVITVYVGLRLTWISLGGGIWPVLKQVAILVLSLILGRLLGRLFHLQKLSNRLGRFAKERLSQEQKSAQRQNDGFITATVLFCVAPMAVLGAIQDGMTGYWQTLGLKALVDGLATMAFVTMFGWGVMLSIIPVVAYQGTLTLAARWLAPFLRDHDLLDSVNVTGGLLVFCVALVILELKKVELADYLPSIVVAPVLTYLWR